MGQYVDLFDSRLKETRANGYAREAYQSILTAPEWMSVDLSEQFGNHLAEKKTMFHFPYFNQIFELWRVLFNALYFSIQASGFFKTIFSDYFVMDLFIVCFTTLELLPKGFISILLYPFLSQKNDTEMQTHLADYYQTFAKSLETTPFYQHDYQQSLETLSVQWANCKKWTWTDYWSWSVVWLDLQSKKFISRFLQDTYDEDPCTQILVKYNAVDVSNPKEAIRAFQAAFKAVPNAELINDDVYAKSAKVKNNTVYTSVYARINVPRYMAFKACVTALGAEGIYVRKIAGQSHVMLKCDVKASDKTERKTYQNRVLNKVKAVTPLYAYGDGQDPGHALCLFKAPVKKLDKTIRRLEKPVDPSVTSSVKLIHNF